ncbi:Acetyl-CoA hydrolase/transferase C-terminal domain containing protein [Aphelenchoides avenae]|nr:Acetyl-CoA hydrolase/transferase C-terminal domain containing protein [Aphelenchus avenae]
MKVRLKPPVTPVFRSQRRWLTGLRPGDSVRQLSAPVPDRTPKYCSPEEAVSSVKTGDSIFVHHAGSTPVDLLAALCERVDKQGLRKIRLTHGLLCGKKPWIAEKFHERIRSSTLFLDADIRKLANAGKADYMPTFLSESARLYDDKVIPVDVALLNVSPPDEHGYCSLGINVDMSSAGARNAKVLIGSINESQPRTFGDTAIHISHFDALTNATTPVCELPAGEISDVEKRIGELIATELVDNGATLQMGIGSIPDAVLSRLRDHKDLGVHTEMISESLVDLVKCGAITNARKSLYPGKCVASFAFGTRKLYDYLNNNPLFLFGSAGFTNAVPVVASNSKMTAVNSAIEVDLTGQVVSDSIGNTFYSGFGGQVDFIYGSSIGFDGLGKAGSGVVTTRAHVRYVVTEFGIAALYGRNVRQRAYELIQIAHPDDREGLEKSAFERFKCLPSKD